jgi:hypothetical protein
MRGFAGNNGRSLVSIICEVVFSAMPPQIEIRSGDRDFAGAFAGLCGLVEAKIVIYTINEEVLEVEVLDARSNWDSP